jgi:L-2-hydroxycarboxylate dehydrogenase (NAD+)
VFELVSQLYEKGGPYPPDEYKRFNHEALKGWVVEVFTALGMAEEDASVVADVLVVADLMGVSSHGVQRVKRYVDGIKSGSVNIRPEIKVVKNYGATAIIDADSSLGHPPTLRAMKLAVEKARSHGVGIVGVRNSHHFGIAGYYALKAVESGMIGLVITNSTPLVSYVNTVGKYLGTNPIAVAVPTSSPPPILFDAATSVVPVGRIEIYAKTGKPIPEGWVIDSEGNMLSGDAVPILKAIKEGKASLLPLGGVGELLGGHKGSGFSLLVDIFSGILTGSGWGSHVRYTVGDKPGNVGHLVMALNIEAFGDRNNFFHRLESMVNEVKGLRKHPNADRVWIPGEKAWLTMETRKRIGIPIHANVVEELERVGEEVGVRFKI